jgi:hypothetical protein
MNTSNKPLNFKDPSKPMDLEEATTLLKKLGEWDSVYNLDRETILKWAEFLKRREVTPKTVPKKK